MTPPPWPHPHDPSASAEHNQGMTENDDEDGASIGASRRISAGLVASFSRSADDFSLRRQQQQQQQQLEVNNIVDRGSFSGGPCEVGSVQPLPPLKTSSSFARPQNVASTMAALPRRYEYDCFSLRSNHYASAISPSCGCMARFSCMHLTILA